MSSISDAAALMNVFKQGARDLPVSKLVYRGTLGSTEYTIYENSPADYEIKVQRSGARGPSSVAVFQNFEAAKYNVEAMAPKIICVLNAYQPCNPTVPDSGAETHIDDMASLEDQHVNHLVGLGYDMPRAIAESKSGRLSEAVDYILEQCHVSSVNDIPTEKRAALYEAAIHLSPFIEEIHL